VRFRPISSVAVVIGLLLPAVVHAADDAKSYKVTMERMSKVGDKVKIDAVAAYRNQMAVKVGDEDPKTLDESVGIRVEATAEVKEAKDGRRTKVAYTIKECSLQVGDKTKKLLSDGDVVEARWEKDTTKYAVEGKDIPDELTEVFDLVFELPDPQSALDDEIFRTSEKKKVGDTWSIDAAAAKKELGRIGINTKEEELWGETTLVEGPKADDKQNLKVKTSFKARNMSGPGRKADDKMKLDAGTLSIETTMLLPIDDKQPPAKEEVKISSTGEMSGKNDEGKPMKLSRVSERVIERTMGPVEK
jgi:hypothetical protein